MKQCADITIVGCGCVGLAIALGLSKRGISVTLIDTLPEHISNQTDRLFALSLSSEDFFKNNKIPIELNQLGQAILGIEVFESGMDSSLRFNPSDIELENFGYMVSEMLLMKELHQKVKEETIPLLKAQVIKLSSDKNFAYIELSNGITITSELVVIADGKHSKSRAMVGIESYKKPYGEIAITFDIEHEQRHNGVAVEKFMPAGPFAVLPRIGGHKSSIVWAESRDSEECFKNMSQEMLSDLLKTRIEDMLGKVSIVSKPVVFPLQLVYSESFYKGRFVLAGDALHSIHPLAGQGLNVGLRDSAAIVSLVAEQYNLGLNLGSDILLKAYEKRRYTDVHTLITATDFLNQLFISQLPFMSPLRKLGLGLVDNILPLKRFFARNAVGRGIVMQHINS